MDRTRGWGARGAGLVEYALVLALVVLAAQGGILVLQDRTGDEIDNQAECISTRPPPPGCQQAALSPTTTGGGGGGGGSSGSGGAGSSPPASITATPPAVTPTGSIHEIDLGLTVLDTSDPLVPVPLVDEVVTAQVTVTGSTIAVRVGQSFFVDCTTVALGACAVAFDSRWADVTQLTYEVVNVGLDTSYEFTFEPIVIDLP